MNRTTSGSQPPGLVAMSLDFQRDKNKALLLNQPSLEDTLARAQDLGVDLNASRDGKKSFFTSDTKISRDVDPSPYNQQKARINNIVYRQPIKKSTKAS